MDQYYRFPAKNDSECNQNINMKLNFETVKTMTLEMLSLTKSCTYLNYQNTHQNQIKGPSSMRGPNLLLMHCLPDHFLDKIPFKHSLATFCPLKKTETKICRIINHLNYRQKSKLDENLKPFSFQYYEFMTS